MDRSCGTCNWYVQTSQVPGMRFASEAAEDFEQDVCRLNPPVFGNKIEQGLTGPQIVVVVRGLSIPNRSYWCSHWEPSS